MIFSTTAFFFKFFWSILTFIWRFFTYLIQFVIIIANITFVYLYYWFRRGRGGRQSDVKSFLIDQGAFLALPTFVNHIFISKYLTWNLILPLYITIFIDLQSNNNLVTLTFIRNAVFLIFVCTLF
jgi:hypothetical protein